MKNKNIAYAIRKTNKNYRFLVQRICSECGRIHYYNMEDQNASFYKCQSDPVQTSFLADENVQQLHI